ncbi:MAG TPA: hypothetical protein PLC89_26710 [Haliscomenobacter sp.]|uniref:DUF6891 domain-containing protein n=1 Tax=Haliscomenobacter sp. TaxID=2717303 RepID=UPI002C24E1A7|nr:hypothetical protein [Haliscomenobacter sp.]HOY20935.1 hypothetical protein [Haliscomenobacter sp.]
MTDDIKNEALEQLELDIKFGFENEDELFESIREMFYNEDDFDEDWLRKTISEKYNQHQNDSLTWTRPNDFDRLAKSFDQLINNRIVCLHKASYTKQDGEGDCMETIEKLNKLGIKAIGFCYYHAQDLARTVDKDIRNLYLGFDSPTQDDHEALQVANKIVSTLKENSFEISWTGTVDQRIEIKNINWQKIPDNEDWDSERVISILIKTNNNKKTFWKFW